MMLLNGGLLYDLLEITVALTICVIAYYKWAFTYWKRRGLEVPRSPTIPVGNISEMVTKKCTYGEQFKIIYDQIKEAGLKHAGIYMFAAPVYVPIDPEILKSILLKDFQHFVNHGTFMNEKGDPLSAHLFSMEDQKWRNWRTKLTPTFTSGKMKMMLETMIATTPGLKAIMDEHAITKAPLDIKETFARFTTDIIGSCAFGIECNSVQNPNAAFRKHGKMAMEEITFMDNMKMLAQFFVPHSILRYINMKTTKDQVEKFFMSIVNDTVKYREKNNIYRKDFMHLLLQLKNRGKVSDDTSIKNGEKTEDHMSLNELAAQCYLFFIAGFETSSTTSTFALYELAYNQEIQQKLRDEIQRVLKKHDGKVTYEALTEMTYMENVIHESLRKYPPVPAHSRTCTKTYRVRGTDVVISEGTRVQIPVMGIQRDPEYYPDPDRFDPDRFTEENKQKRPQFTWLPFGEGPRICIGARFGMMQTKVGLTALLKDYKVTLNKQTQVPLKLRPSGIILAAEGGVFLDVEKVTC